LLFSLAPSTNRINILIACHTTKQEISEELRQGLLFDEHFSCHIFNEISPHSLSGRANLIGWCDVFVVVISRLYQRTPFCMEAINYAKDLRKPIIVILAETTFRPNGALGAISASAIRSITLIDFNSLVDVVSQVANEILNKVKKSGDFNNVTDPTTVRIV
jgi:hypothetical protein